MLEVTSDRPAYAAKADPSAVDYGGKSCSQIATTPECQAFLPGFQASMDLTAGGI